MSLCRGPRLPALAMHRDAVAERDKLSRMRADEVPAAAIRDECVQVRVSPAENVELGVTLRD